MVSRGRVREAWRYGAVVEPRAGVRVSAPEVLTQGRPIEHTGETRLPAGESATNQVPDYDSTAELREALTSDDADRRSQAYGDVFEADLQPKQVLSDEPPEEALAEAGLIPAGGGGPNAAADRERMIELLEEISSKVGGGS